MKHLITQLVPEAYPADPLIILQLVSIMSAAPSQTKTSTILTRHSVFVTHRPYKSSSQRNVFLYKLHDNYLCYSTLRSNWDLQTIIQINCNGLVPHHGTGIIKGLFLCKYGQMECLRWTIHQWGTNVEFFDIWINSKLRK